MNNKRLIAIITMTFVLLVAQAVAKETLKPQPPSVAVKTHAVASDKTSDKKQKKWDVNHPPGESYWANIDVTEGTWMSLDVSPDGKQIVFDLLGDIYIMPITGGEAKAITHSIAWEMQPTFSPNGKQIAFTSDQAGGDNIWMMDVDGTNQRQITKEKFRLVNSPTWSPDGKFIAARKHFTSQRSLGAGEIWLYHIAGGSGIQLNKRPNDQKDLGEPVFSASGDKVYFSRDSTPGPVFEYSKDSNNIIYEIFSIDRKDGKIRNEISGMGGSVRPTPSPDGKQMAFVRRIRNQSSLFVKDLNTGNETAIYTHLDRDMQETWAIHGVYPHFAWTPDSQSVILWADGEIHRISIANKQSKVIPFHIQTKKEMRKAVRFKQNPAANTFETKLLRWVQVRPDGKQLVFQALGQLYVKNLPSGKTKRLTKNNNEFAFYPSYSKDGRWIVYTSWNDDTQGAVKMIRSNGGKSRQLTKQPGKYISPRFSNDAKQVVYQKVKGGRLLSPDYSAHTGIYWLDVKKRQANMISESGNYPFFSRDDKRIYLTQYAGKKTALISLNRQGLDKRQHASSRWASEFSLSPDESLISFKERYNIYLAPFTATGKAIELNPKASNLPILRITKQGGNYLSWSADSRQVNWSLGSTLNQLALPKTLDWKELSKKLKPQQTHLGFNTQSDQVQGDLLLAGAKIISMKGDQVIAKGDIWVHNNQIKAVATSGSLKLPSKIKTIDVSGKTIIPGIVDVHWHGSQGSNQITPQQNWMNLASLAFGVTTIHDPSNDTAEIFAAAEMARKGILVAPRIFSTGRILYGAETYFTAEIDSLDDAIGHLNRLKQQGAFSVKSYNQPRRDQRQQVLEAARETNMMVVPEGGSTLAHNLTMIIDGHTGVEHSIPVAAVYEDIKQLWSQSETGYTPTLVVSYGGIWGENYWYQASDVWKHPLLSRYVPNTVLYPRAIRRNMAPKEDYNHFHSAQVAAELQKRGVGVQLGAHGQREGLGAHWEMWMFAQGGMSAMNVIKAATLDGAKYLGMDQYIGSIEAGKLADLVILETDPLQNIYATDKVSMVMINGRLYDSKTMNEIGLTPITRKDLFFQ